MALLHFDGFETYWGSDADLYRQMLSSDIYITTNSVPSLETSVARTGSQSLNVSYSKYYNYRHPTTFSNDTVYFGAAFYFETGDSQYLVKFMDSAYKEQISIRRQATTNVLALYSSSGVAIYAGTIPLALDTWYYIEGKIKITNNTSAGDAIFKINNVTDISIPAGYDICGQSNTSLRYLNFNSMFLYTGMYIDDLYVCDDTGSYNNTFLGDCIVEAKNPNGNGSSTQWDGSDGDQTDNYLLVDDGATLDNADYVEAQNISETDLYAYENLLFEPDTIYGIRIKTNIFKAGVGERKYKLMCRSNSTNYEIEEYNMGQGTDDSITDDDIIIETDPATSALWTKNNFDLAEFGVALSN